jgi:multicomponent Na+:H+ antiporter subunit E
VSEQRDARAGFVRRRLRRPVAQWPAVTGLTVAWVLLWGDVTWANVVGGVVLSTVVVVVFPLPPVRTEARLRFVPFCRLFVRFVTDLTLASFQVAWTALRPGRVPQGALVRVQLRDTDDVFLTLTAVLAALVPGTLVVETRRRTGTLFLHVLDAEAAGGTAGVRRSVRDLEERVLRALAADEVLERCGIAPSSDRKEADA